MNSFDPDALECLAAIVEEGGFERAALRLSITQSAVSQRLRALESQAGTVLIVRSRPVRPTLAGQLLLKHAKMSRLLRADLELELRGLAPSKAAGQREHERVAIAINADSIACWALPALHDLACRGLPLELITDDQDFTLQWLREGQVLGCVTALSQPLPGCRVQALGAMEYLAVAERGYAQKHLGPLRAGATLLGMHNFRSLPFVAFNRKDSIPAQLVARTLGLKAVNLQQLFVPSPQAMVQAVQAGWGVGVLPRLLVQPLLDQGVFVELLPGQSLHVPLFWHCWNLQSQVLADLSAALQAAAGRELRAPQALAPKVCDAEALAAA
jgi:LysR family transcriptional regulator (chromosome initiation inhibitor)